MAFALGFSTNLCFKYYTFSVPSVTSNPSIVSRTPIDFASFSSSVSVKCATHPVKLNHTPRASAEGIPSDLIEDSKFVPLNADDPVYGPPVLFCTEDMIAQSLWEAMHTSQPNLETVQIAESLPRICFLSGLSGEEMMMFIDAFPETGLEEAAFAALVPNSSNKPLQELIEEIMGDHEMLTGKQPSSS